MKGSMRSYSALVLLQLTANFSHAASPVLPLEMISRNAQGQQATNARVSLDGMSANGNRVAFTMTDRSFFNEPPPPPPNPSGSLNFREYGQIALWQRGRAPVPLIDFRDGFGATNFPSGVFSTKHVKLHESSERVCLLSDGGDLVMGIRGNPSDGGVACSDQPGPPYYYLLGLDGTGLRPISGTYGGERFDLYGGSFNILLRDRHTGSVESVSLANDGHVATTHDLVDVSDNGAWVVFQSADNSLTLGDTGASLGWNNVPGNDFFIRDRVARTTRRLLRPDGRELLGQLNRFSAFSANGRFLVFSTTGDVVEPCLTNFNGPPTQGLSPEPIFVHDFQTNTTECISLTQSGQAFGNAYASEDNRVSMSGDGRFVAYSTRFAADASDTNNKADIYLRDRKLNRTIWVSQAANGAPGNSRSVSPLLSEDGRWLAFVSYASNLVPNDTNLPPFGDPSFQGGDIFLRDLSALSVEPVQVPAGSNWGWALLVLGLVGFGMRARQH